MQIRYNFAVAKVSRQIKGDANSGFVVEDSMGNKLKAKRVILATGLPKEKHPEVEGATAASPG